MLIVSLFCNMYRYMHKLMKNACTVYIKRKGLMTFSSISQSHTYTCRYVRVQYSTYWRKLKEAGRRLSGSSFSRQQNHRNVHADSKHTHIVLHLDSHHHPVSPFFFSFRMLYIQHTLCECLGGLLLPLPSMRGRKDCSRTKRVPLL